MRDCKDRRSRIQKLQELAERGATEGERRAARAALDRIQGNQSENETDWSFEGTKEIEYEAECEISSDRFKEILEQITKATEELMDSLKKSGFVK